VKFTLELNDHEVIMAKNGEDALEILYKDKPDLVLLDIRMPRLNGYEVCRTIKEDPTLQTIPVLFLSAKGQDTEVQEGLATGADGYIIKPFSPDQLIEHITKALK
jgi:CheY-like chemotaxis protein